MLLALLAGLLLLTVSPVAAKKTARELFQAADIPYDAYDRSVPAGKARAMGLRATGQPEPYPGLVNPDVPAINNETSTMEDLVLPWGYPLETYPVPTVDGFVLRMYRIPYGKKNSTKPDPNKPVVLLHHGVTLASSSWVVLDPESSPAFYFADAGFDVWMVNTRGNTYSRGNKYWRSVDQAFWEFSIDELALIDLPAQIDYVLNKTGQAQLALVGHSQGGSIPLMLLGTTSTMSYNNKIWLLMLLGPVTHSEYIKAPFLANQAKTASSLLLSNAGAGRFIPNVLTNQLIHGCKKQPETDWCFDFFNFMFYGPSKYVSADDFNLVASTWPSGVSIRNLLHWSQMWHTRNGIYMYDWGEDCSQQGPTKPLPLQETCNQAKYGSETPPQYDFSRVNTTAALFQGDMDLMGTQPDIEQLKERWNATLIYDKMWPDTAHMDFVWSRRPIMKADMIRVLWDYAPAKYH